MTAVVLHNLTKRFGSEVAAVDNLCLEIKSGELVGFLGPSGCGKTTTLKMVAGLLHPTDGDITFDGLSVLDIPPERRGAVMVFQNHLLFPYMNVIDNVSFGLRMRNLPKRATHERARHMLDLVRLSGFEQRRPTELSGGQQQRVALARALVTEPRLLLLDEPLSNLDAHLRYEMRELILSLQRKLKITTIFVTHDQQEAVILSDRTAVIFQGILQQFGKPRDFYERPASERVARFFGTENFLEGVLSGGAVETSLGKLELTDCQQTEGRVLVSIRPDAIVVNGAGTNTLDATVISSLYSGTNTRLSLDIAGIELQAIESAHVKYAPGDRVTVTFPPERVVLIPTTSGNGAKAPDAAAIEDSFDGIVNQPSVDAHYRGTGQ